MSRGPIWQAVETEAERYRDPEDHDYRGGLRFGGQVAVNVLRSEAMHDDLAAMLPSHVKIDMEFRPLRCSCGDWDATVESWSRHIARAVLAHLTEGAA